MRKLLAIAATTGLIAVGFLASPASADPSTGEGTITLDCGAGMAYDIVVTSGNGDFTPGFDTQSNRMFIPVEFGAAMITITAEDGTVIEFTEPGEAKAGKRVGVQGKIIECTFTDTFTFEDEQGMTVKGTVEGMVRGFFTGRRS